MLTRLMKIIENILEFQLFFIYNNSDFMNKITMCCVI